MAPAWGGFVTGGTNGPWPVTGPASPVCLAGAAARTQRQSRAGMAAQGSPGSALVRGSSAPCSAGAVSSLTAALNIHEEL